MNEWLRRMWGGAAIWRDRARGLGWVDLIVASSLLGLLYGVLSLSREWTGALRPAVEIDLAPLALPRYAFYSLSRGVLAYLLSLLFALLYGYWAAKSRVAEVVLLPLLDILQSIPVLAFMPGLVFALVAVFPASNVGLELAAILMIFTGQAWNLTFSFYHSLRSIPPEQLEAATIYGFDWWQRFRWVELPSSAIGLVWNSMVSMAGGWFFLVINEAFVLGDKDFRLPGLGSYMSVALARGNLLAMLWAMLAMILVIVALDQLVWRPVAVWAQKFRVEEGEGEGGEMASWFLDFLRRSRLPAAFQALAGVLRRGLPRRSPAVAGGAELARRLGRVAGLVSLVLFSALLGALLLGAFRLFGILRGVPGAEWLGILTASIYTLGRVLAATALGTLWALPAGLAIGLNPRLSRALQPVLQIVASFPAPMLFPAAIAVLGLLGMSLGWGSILLMLLGTQWYILFNVVAGATAIPADLKEAARSYRIRGRQRFLRVLLPAVFPYLVTGWVTAAGGAWNASIVAEYVSFRGQVWTARGVGAMISQAAEQGQFAHLAAAVVVMSALVVLFNRLVWKRLYELAEQRFSLAK